MQMDRAKEISPDGMETRSTLTIRPVIKSSPVLLVRASRVGEGVLRAQAVVYPTLLLVEQTAVEGRTSRQIVHVVDCLSTSGNVGGSTTRNLSGIKKRKSGEPDFCILKEPHSRGN